jgi:hypothetical protein
VAWLLTPRAQHQERVRRIGVLMNLAENDPEASARISAFVQRLSQLGWTEGRTNRLSLGSQQERMVWLRSRRMLSWRLAVAQERCRLGLAQKRLSPLLQVCTVVIAQDVMSNQA